MTPVFSEYKKCPVAKSALTSQSNTRHLDSNIAGLVEEFDIKIFFTLLFVFLFSSLLFAQSAGSDLFQLGKIQNGVKTKRISSYDRSGGNNDRFGNIKDKEKRTIFDVKGAGMINYIQYNSIFWRYS